MRHLRLREPFDSVERERSKKRQEFYQSKSKLEKSDKEYVIDGFKILDDAIIGYEGRAERVFIPSGVKKISSYAFQNNSSMVEIEIPDKIEIIEEGAFAECRNLRKVKLPKSLKILSKYLFSSCENLESVKFPEMPFLIGENAFLGCYKLHKDGLLIIGDSLIGCSIDESEICIPSSIKKIGSKALMFCRARYISIPESVNEIEDGAFWGCDNLKEILIPSSITRIGQFAFQACRQLEKVTLSPNLDTLEDGTFALCNQIKELTIPEGVRTIGRGILLENRKIESIYLPESVIEIDEYAFSNTQKSQITIYAPQGSFSEEFAKRNMIRYCAMGVAASAVVTKDAENEYEKKFRLGKLSYRDALAWKKKGYINGTIVACKICNKAIHSETGLYYKDSHNSVYAYCGEMCELFDGVTDKERIDREKYLRSKNGE